MQLSQRLTKVASMVTEGNRLADVGTDHGYVPIYLYQEKKIPGGIAMDVNLGPLERARLHIEEYGFSHAIETRLSNGLEKLKPKEADTILIAGMGGPLVVRILDAYPEVAASAKELVLQPQSEIDSVRKYLEVQGYEIVQEHMVLEEGKYYPMMKAVKNPAAAPMEPWELIYGRLSVMEEPEVLASYLHREWKQKKEIIEKLKKEGTPKSLSRIEEISRLLLEYEQMLERISEKS